MARVLSPISPTSHPLLLLLNREGLTLWISPPPHPGDAIGGLWETRRPFRRVPGRPLTERGAPQLSELVAVLFI